MGGAIYLLFGSKIDDLELSWHVSNSPNETIFSKFSKGDAMRIYYGIRNRVFFELQNLVDNKIIYLLNIVIFILLDAMHKYEEHKCNY